MKGLILFTAEQIVKLINAEDLNQAAQLIVYRALAGDAESTAILRELRPHRDKNSKLMYEIEDLLAAAPVDEHDHVVRALAYCGWYGQPVTGLKFVFLQPALKSPNSLGNSEAESRLRPGDPGWQPFEYC